MPVDILCNKVEGVLELSDRLTMGFIAGIVAGIVMNIESYVAYALDLDTLRFVDWSGVIIFGHQPPFSVGEILFAQLCQLFITGVLGIIFVYLIPRVTSENIVLKGWIYSVATWLVIYVLDIFLLEIEGITELPLRSAVSNIVGASFYGLVLAWLTKRFANKLPS